MQEKCILLADFQAAYDAFPLKIIDLDDRLDRIVVQPIRDALERCFLTVEVLRLEVIRTEVSAELGSESYTVTLDGGTYFPEFDYSIELTRAALSMDNAYKGPYLRVPREGAPNIINSGLRLADHYRRYGDGRPLVLCDDGISTGGSVSKLISILGDLNIRVNKIVVLLNPSDKAAIDGVDITAVFERTGTYVWHHERDFVWGLPRSGASYAYSDDKLSSCGIPYTVDTKMISAKLHLDPMDAEQFRQDCLNFNVVFWEFLERNHNRPLLVADCTRLRLPFGPLSIDDTRICDVLRAARDSSFSLTSASH